MKTRSIYEDAPAESLQMILQSEANHRIANGLSAIAAAVRLQARDDARVLELRSPRQVRALLEEVGARIETVARLHRLLAQPHTGSEIDLSGHLLSVANTIMASHWADCATFEHDLDPACSLPLDMAFPVSMIVAELITNSLKYAHPTGVAGQIRLECRAIDGGVQICVGDDGVGLPDGFDPASAPSLGYRLIHALAKQVGAQVRFAQPGIGLHTILTVTTGGSAPSRWR